MISDCNGRPTGRAPVLFQPAIVGQQAQAVLESKKEVELGVQIMRVSIAEPTHALIDSGDDGFLEPLGWPSPAFLNAGIEFAGQTGQYRGIQGFNKIKIVEGRYSFCGHRLNRPTLAAFETE
jgi:hypothetical protein